MENVEHNGSEKIRILKTNEVMEALQAAAQGLKLLRRTAAALMELLEAMHDSFDSEGHFQENFDASLDTGDLKRYLEAVPGVVAQARMNIERAPLLFINDKNNMPTREEYMEEMEGIVQPENAEKVIDAFEKIAREEKEKAEANEVETDDQE